jgi:pyruvate/2-oxoglutarate dehydrogenase complex dihydrolipoamide acyltransferase (E2) component
MKCPVMINDKLAIRSRPNLGLAVDHRIMDGAVAVRFLQDVENLYVNPYLLFKA